MPRVCPGGRCSGGRTTQVSPLAAAGGANAGLIRFSSEDVDRAIKEWGFNCGPGALCAVLSLTPDELRPFLGDFEKKGYTNPTLMLETLSRCGARYERVYRGDVAVYFPSGIPLLDLAVMRIQWSGRWTRPGVPMRVRYRHTHWVAVRKKSNEVFDVNASRWMPWAEWAHELVPWLIGVAVIEGADGGWWPTHAYEVEVAR